jgi:16S rRNA (guanine(966)-N(2))-methyltransferase RsmD
LGSDVIGSRFLDLFAGTGGVGIEALSRGAAEVIFVERGGKALRTIRDNLAHTGLAEGGRVERADVFAYLARPPAPSDYVYVAPPQYQGLWADTLHALDRQPGWLYEDGWVIVQIHPREYKDLPLQAWTLFDQRTYGSVMLCFYERANT